ncbi:microfibril-associated glycoprotein 4-like [Ruditapes philippinarum]|uniref:microfibril-associated glycoprotein 4-like n=1 Tax=Ruditapes philippinarum TaxID=129788 RepID=UPI00295A6343|nr:microfibril-associated glycoprotein 4-like [Ruditapes philippinarum]
MRTRRRLCTNPRPQRFGDHCFGDNIEDELCNNGTCAVNGGWTDWSKWGQCSVSCGVGLQSRTRSCTDPTPDNGGLHCIGQNLKDQLCYKGLCVGVWTNWNDWSEGCSSGVQTRNRTCLKNLFSGGCEGDLTEKKKCDIPETYKDCYEIKENTDIRKDGVYNVTLWKSKLIIPVFCDFETDGGGWTVFQKRFDGSIDFYKSFIDFERGFGSVDSEFWLGLSHIYEMVSLGKTELRLDLKAADGTSVYETFQNFRLGKQPYYTLHIDKGIGNSGDGLSYHNGMHFTAFDNDRDTYGGNCAVLDRGGWWYNKCTDANLNGEYVTPGTQRPGRAFGGMIYYPFKKTESLRSSKMMFRRV